MLRTLVVVSLGPHKTTVYISVDKTHKNKTWSQVFCSVPLHKGLRIAQFVGTSNAESPTSMI